MVNGIPSQFNTKLKKISPPPPTPIELLHGDVIELKEIAKVFFEHQIEDGLGKSEASAKIIEALAMLAAKINPNIDVQAPIVNVPAPVVNVPAPVVNVPAPVVNVEAPIINVPPPDVIFDNVAVLKRLDEIIEQSKVVPVNKPLSLSKEDRFFLEEIIERLDTISKKEPSVQVSGGRSGGGLMQAQMNDLVPALTNGKTATPRLTARHALHVNLRDANGAELGTTTDPVNVEGSISIAPSATAVGTDTFRNAAVSNSAVAVKVSDANMYGYNLFNPGIALAYVHFYDVAQASVVVGTTVPKLSLALPSNATATVGVDAFFGANPINFATAITIAATTTPGGGTAPGTAIVANVAYK